MLLIQPKIWFALTGLQEYITASCPACHLLVLPSPFQQGCTLFFYTSVVLIAGITTTQVQDYALGFVEPCKIHLGPLFESE